MFKWFKYISLGAAVMTIAAEQMPAALADGKLTVGEIVDMFSLVAGAAGYPVQLQLPPELQDQTVAVFTDRA